MERIHGRERDEKGRFIDDDAGRASPIDGREPPDKERRREPRTRHVYGAGYAARESRPDADQRSPKDRH